jgi:hypothetical protein
MICKSCANVDHTKCRGGNWCDCQHNPPKGNLTQTLDPTKDK